MNRDAIDIGIAILLAVAILVAIVRAVTLDHELDQLIALSWGILAAVGLVLIATVRR